MASQIPSPSPPRGAESKATSPNPTNPKKDPGTFSSPALETQKQHTQSHDLQPEQSADKLVYMCINIYINLQCMYVCMYIYIFIVIVIYLSVYLIIMCL